MLNALTEINLDDLVSSFGWQSDLPGYSRMPAAVLRRVFRAPAAKFARMMAAFDGLTGEKSLPVAARKTLKSFSQSLEIFGQEHLPISGPVLFLSNHPGMVDTLALFDAINRSDLRIIALNRPFLLSLPNTANHLIFISEDPGQRLRAVRQAANHLKAGGSLLTFPAGQIEPDPLVYPGALESLQKWTDSAGVFLRFAPETSIVPVVVRGVLWERAVKFPLTRLKAIRQERESLGAALQLLAHILFNAHPLRIQIQFARPIRLAEIGSTELNLVQACILERMRGLLKNPPGEAGDLPGRGLA